MSHTCGYFDTDSKQIGVDYAATVTVTKDAKDSITTRILIQQQIKESLVTSTLKYTGLLSNGHLRISTVSLIPL